MPFRLANEVAESTRRRAAYNEMAALEVFKLCANAHQPLDGSVLLHFSKYFVTNNRFKPTDIISLVGSAGNGLWVVSSQFGVMVVSVHRWAKLWLTVCLDFFWNYSDCMSFMLTNALSPITLLQSKNCKFQSDSTPKSSVEASLGRSFALCRVNKPCWWYLFHSGKSQNNPF